MLELAGDGPTPEQRSRCPRLSSPSSKTPTAPRKEYDVSKRIKEPTRAPLQSIDSRAVQVRLNSSVPVSVAQAKQGVQEQNVARQSGSVGCGLEAPICMHVEQHLENRAENKYAVDHAARLEALEAALDISLESLQQTSSDSQSAGGINADADGADSKIETDAGGVDDINAQIDRFLLLHLHAGDLEICTQLAQDAPADPIIGEDNLPSRVGTASSQHCATEEHSKMERLSSNAFTAIPRLAQELPLEQEEQRSPTARGQRSFLVLEHEKQRKEQEEVLLRNEHLVHDNCKVQKPEHVPFPKVLEVKPMVVGMRRGDSAAEKHGFQSGDIVPVKPSVDGLVVNDDDLKCHLMDPAAQPQQQIAEQEEQQECSSINVSFPLLSSCSHYSSADSSHAWGTTAFGQVVDCSKYNTMVDTRQVVSSSKTVVPEDDDPLSLFSSHSPGGRPWEGSYAVVSPHGLRNSDRGDVDSKVPAHLLSGPTPWMGTPPRVGAARFGGSWRAWQESSADSGLLVWGTGASDTRAVQVHDSIPLNNELVKEQIWDEATMAAVAFQDQLLSGHHVAAAPASPVAWTQRKQLEDQPNVQQPLRNATICSCISSMLDWLKPDQPASSQFVNVHPPDDIRPDGMVELERLQVERVVLERGRDRWCDVSRELKGDEWWQQEMLGGFCHAGSPSQHSESDGQVMSTWLHNEPAGYKGPIFGPY